MTEIEVAGLSTRTRVVFGGDRPDELAAVARAAWSRCLDVDPALPETPPVSAALYPNDHAGARPEQLTSDTPAGLMPALAQKITYAKIGAQTGRLFMVHASAVAAADGTALAFVAPGGTGKTTLARRLAHRFGYLTDETVAVDAEARVHAYPKPLSIRPSAGGGPKQETSPDDLRLVRPPAACTLRRIVLLARDDDHAGEPRVEQLSRYAAIAAIAPETSALSDLPRPLHWLDALLDRLDPTVRLHYRDVDTVLELIAGWLEGRP